MNIELLEKMTYEERLNLLKNDLELEKIFILENPFDFKKICELYNISDLLNVFTEKIISKIKPNYLYIYINFFIEKDKNAFLKHLMEKDYLKDILLLKGTYIFIDLPYQILIDLINYNDLKKYDFSKTSLYMLIYSSLKEISLQEKFLKEKINNYYKIKMFDLFDKDLVEKYINENIISIPNKSLYNIIIKNRFYLNENLYHNFSFFKECILKNDIYKTRIELDSLNTIIDTSYFEKLFLKTKDNILKESNDKKLVLDIIIDNLFLDSTHNVYLNLCELIDYNDKYNILSIDKLKFYKELLEIYKEDSDNIKDFYNKYKDIYNYTMFYDDLSILKRNSYQVIKDNCLKLDDLKKLKRSNLSSNYNLDIYELNGEPFRMLISCRARIPKGYNESPRNCYTLIGNENMFVFNENSIIYGYLDFNINNIMHVYEADSYSEDKEYKTTNYINRIRTIEEILNANHKSEIQIRNNKIDKGKYERLLPSYIICFDSINDRSIEAAHDLNIPIIIIDRTKYKKLNGNNNLINYEEEYTLLPNMESSVSRKKLNRI